MSTDGEPIEVLSLCDGAVTAEIVATQLTMPWRGDARRLELEWTKGRLPRELFEDDFADEATAFVTFGPGWARLSALYVPVPARGWGIGEAMVRKAQQMAAIRGLPLLVEAIPFGVEPLAEDLLRAWYHMQAFVAVPGHPYALCWQALASTLDEEIAAAQCDQEEAEEGGDLEERLDAAFNVTDLEAQRRRAAHALATEM